MQHTFSACVRMLETPRVCVMFLIYSLIQKFSQPSHTWNGYYLRKTKALCAMLSQYRTHYHHSIVSTQFTHLPVRWLLLHVSTCTLERKSNIFRGRGSRVTRVMHIRSDAAKLWTRFPFEVLWKMSGDGFACVVCVLAEHSDVIEFWYAQAHACDFQCNNIILPFFDGFEYYFNFTNFFFAVR